LQNIFQKL